MFLIRMVTFTKAMSAHVCAVKGESKIHHLFLLLTTNR